MQKLKCIKCLDEIVIPDDDGFYRCEKCERRYKLSDTGKLVERWLGPISIVLYPVIFTKSPQNKAEGVAQGLYESILPNGKRMFRELTLDQIEYLISEINNEISNPTQNVKDILRCVASETDLREYLAIVVKKLCELLNRE